MGPGSSAGHLDCLRQSDPLPPLTSAALQGCSSGPRAQGQKAQWRPALMRLAQSYHRSAATHPGGIEPCGRQAQPAGSMHPGNLHHARYDPVGSSGKLP